MYDVPVRKNRFRCWADAHTSGRVRPTADGKNCTSDEREAWDALAHCGKEFHAGDDEVC